MKLQVPRETTRKTYIEGQLLGVEKRASPSEVGKGRASHMRNFWLSDGVNKKRLRCAFKSDYGNYLRLFRSKHS